LDAFYCGLYVLNLYPLAGLSVAVSTACTSQQDILSISLSLSLSLLFRGRDIIDTFSILQTMTFRGEVYKFDPPIIYTTFGCLCNLMVPGRCIIDSSEGPTSAAYNDPPALFISDPSREACILTPLKEV
jgi:hypothetical protein